MRIGLLRRTGNILLSPPLSLSLSLSLTADESTSLPSSLCLSISIYTSVYLFISMSMSLFAYMSSITSYSQSTFTSFCFSITSHETSSLSLFHSLSCINNSKCLPKNLSFSAPLCLYKIGTICSSFSRFAMFSIYHFLPGFILSLSLSLFYVC